jgi:hypothetical protein
MSRQELAARRVKCRVVSDEELQFAGLRTSSTHSYDDIFAAVSIQIGLEMLDGRGHGFKSDD